MKMITVLLLMGCSLIVKGQHPIAPQVSIPVYFDNSNSPQEQSEDLRQLTELCGVALLFLDTTLTKDHLVISKVEAPIIQFDRVGISTRVSFILNDSLSNSKIELLYSNSTCSASVWKDSLKLATGRIAREYGSAVLRLVGDYEMTEEISLAFRQVNNYLLKLHTKDLIKVELRSLLNQDSLNIIVGVDYQFNTNFDLIWFDESLRSRLKNLGKSAFNRLHGRYNRLATVTDTIENTALIMHNAGFVANQDRMIQGSLSSIFEVSGDRDYLFLKASQPYLLKINYKYKSYWSGEGKLFITQFSIKNMKTEDFIEMDVYDFVESGFPVLYIDLIRSVIMEDYGTWQINQIVQVIQDVFRLIRLPNESE